MIQYSMGQLPYATFGPLGRVGTRTLKFENLVKNRVLAVFGSFSSRVGDHIILIEMILPYWMRAYTTHDLEVRCS